MDDAAIGLINAQISTMQWGFNVLLVVIGGLGGIILRNLTATVQQQGKEIAASMERTRNVCSELTDADKVLSDKVHSLEILVAGQYVTRQSHERLEEGIFNRLDAIADKMDAMPCRVKITREI